MTDTPNGSDAAAAAEFGPRVRVASAHPVLAHKIGLLRDRDTPPAAFRALLREVTYHLGYEATATLTTVPEPIRVDVPHRRDPLTVPDGGRRLRERVALVPILRSGLGMVEALLELLPDAAVHHIGMYKVVGHAPVQYFNRLPRRCEVDVAYVLDPVVATSSTVSSVVRMLQRWGVPQIHVVSVIGSQTGVLDLVKQYPDLAVTVGTIDRDVSEAGFLLPGLGDSGDRLFGTRVPVPTSEDEAAATENGSGSDGEPSAKRSRAPSES